MPSAIETVSQRVERLAPTIRRLVRRGARRNLSRVLGKARPQDIASSLEGLTPDEQLSVIEVALADYENEVGDVVVELEPSLRTELFRRLTAEKTGRILDSMAVDDEVAVVEALPPDLQQQILDLKVLKNSPELQEQLNYDDDSAGRIMTTELFALPAETTVAEAIGAIQGLGDDVEMIFYLYVVDEAGILVGVTSLRELLMTSPAKKLEDIMTRSVIDVSTDTDQEEVARIAARYDLLAVPVTDHEKRLVGLITVDDVITVVQEEVEEDLFKMVGSSDDELMYVGQSFRVARIRLPWLLVNFFGLLAGGLLIERLSQGLLVDRVGISYKEAFFMTVFVPVIMGMGGNAGSQTSTIAVRGLATGRLTEGQGRFRQFLSQQIRVGGILGVTFAALAVAAAMVLLPVLAPESEHPVIFGIVVGAALFLAVFLASLNGTLVPFIFERFGVDPAVASGPMVTTSCDVLGIGLYFSLAILLFHLFVG